MKTHDLVNRLTTAANTLEDRGFSEGTKRTAEELARALSGSTLPLRLFLAWLARTPEARDEIDETLLTVVDRGTGPISGTGGSVKVGGEPVAGVKSWRVEVHTDITPEPPKNPAQNSEPTGSPLPNVPIRHEDFAPGVKGATAPSRVVNVGNAATFLKQDTFTTRPVSPKDTHPSSLGMTQGFRGQSAVKDKEGKTLVAVCRFNTGERLVEFLDKRGPVLMARLVDGEDRGTVVNICIEFVEPARRAAVLEVLNALPGSEGGFNFSPFDGGRDPWLADAPPINSGTASADDSDQFGELPNLTTVDKTAPQQ